MLGLVNDLYGSTFTPDHGPAQACCSVHPQPCALRQLLSSESGS